jgi:Asp/Glu/hydantoin racemase
VKTYTAPSGPDSINNEHDARRSAEIVFEDLNGSSDALGFDGFVVACYSRHPLTRKLKSLMSATEHTQVIGIFEASISTALSLPSPRWGENIEKFGIVTTGKYWEETLTQGVLDFLGCENIASCKRFKGVESTGLSAAELHTSPPSEVRNRITEATKRLVKDRDVGLICLGCAGMAGMDAIVREACVEELGKVLGNQVHIIDGVKAGIALVDGFVRHQSQGTMPNPLDQVVENAV